MRGKFRLAEALLACQEGLCSWVVMNLVYLYGDAEKAN